MSKTKLSLFDTTLRDGQQTQGVDFSADDKRRIAEALDHLGLDYIEGGWPGANPTDSDFFNAPPKITTSTFTAFGMTKRAGRSAENDDVLAAVINANTPAVCLVGKSHDFHVTKALGITLEENLEAIEGSFAHLAKLGREALYDAEHFFDGYKANPAYALDCLKAAFNNGARWIVLCDTNGGTLPHEVGEITHEVCKHIPGDHVGIHTHDDTGQAVACSLAAVDAGARQIQGTLNGLGERCGNANLTSIIPTLLLKEPYKSTFETGVSESGLIDLTRLSRMLDDILNRVANAHAPYVGHSAFAHKAGLHASAILKDPSTYEHVSPDAVGNGLEVEKGDPRLARILEQIKEREDRGYAYDSALASFELVARKELNMLPKFFDVERYRVSVERRRNARDEMITVSEAVVVVNVKGERMMSVSESRDHETDTDQGPVNALSRALAKDLGPFQQYIQDIDLVDFRVRITNGGTVIIDSQDSEGRQWSTVGVSANIVDASFQALLDAINWKLIRDGAGS